MLFATDYPGKYYVNFYIKSFNNFWDNLTPTEYGVILILVGACGYFLLMHSQRR
ncbi:hypothetical protein SH668x_002792 [Planctomicrobium sp. SH668]|uniref:hypothetical protein n=1 Tax=Planctomicrobium sp. SH668 TaxID=3448126 RepID=UPI003F5C4A84